MQKRDGPYHFNEIPDAIYHEICRGVKVFIGVFAIGDESEPESTNRNHVRARVRALNRRHASGELTKRGRRRLKLMLEGPDRRTLHHQCSETDELFQFGLIREKEDAHGDTHRVLTVKGRRLAKSLA